jgi:hypothetical protein
MNERERGCCPCSAEDKRGHTLCSTHSTLTLHSPATCGNALTCGPAPPLCERNAALCRPMRHLHFGNVSRRCALVELWKGEVVEVVARRAWRRSRK